MVRITQAMSRQLSVEELARTGKDLHPIHQTMGRSLTTTSAGAFQAMERGATPPILTVTLSGNTVMSLFVMKQVRVLYSFIQHFSLWWRFTLRSGQEQSVSPLQICS